RGPRGRAPPCRRGPPGAPPHGPRALPLPMMLEGIRVLEIAQNLAGPMAAEILAHLGADVVKVERPEGDDARQWGPPFWKGVSPAFLAVNANKRSVTLDLKDREALAWLETLLGGGDGLGQNLRPGPLA